MKSLEYSSSQYHDVLQTQSFVYNRIVSTAFQTLSSSPSLIRSRGEEGTLYQSLPVFTCRRRQRARFQHSVDMIPVVHDTCYKPKELHSNWSFYPQITAACVFLKRFIAQSVRTVWTRINYKIVPVISLNKYLHYGTSGPGGPGSSVGIATDYSLDGPGSNPGGDEIFRPSRPVLGPHPASCTMGTGSFPEVKCVRGMLRDHSPPSGAAVMEE